MEEILSLSLFEAILLGFVQGLTEFFPVSSSGHLKLIQYFLGLNNLNQYISFDLICHLGTLSAIFAVFFKDITSMIKSNKKLFLLLLFGNLPLLPLYPFLEELNFFFNSPHYLGFFFLITAFLLFIGEKTKRTQTPLLENKRIWFDTFIIGIFQAIALLPGISRSGATISIAFLLGWNRQEATRFSFLLAIPPILGGSILEIYPLLLNPNTTYLPLEHYLAAFFISFIIGLLTLSLILHLAIKKILYPFAWYCSILGLTLLLYLNIIPNR